MPETTPQTKGRKTPRAAQRTRTTPLGAETVPRFAPSASSLGAAYAEQILEGFRKELEDVDLKASPKKRTRSKKT